MLLIILLIVIALIGIGVAIFATKEDGILTGFASLLLTALFGFIALIVIIGGLNILVPGNDGHTERTDSLKAINAGGESISGQFFLGSGYVDGERVINFIKYVEDGGYSVIDSVPGSASRVFEDSDNPTITEYNFYTEKSWLYLGRFPTGTSWDFHVPAESILEDYQIKN